MIFLTVGTQLPFDRLVRAVDDWAGSSGQGDRIFGQIAEPGSHGHVPRHFEWLPHLAPEEFDRRFAAAKLIVAHAGMGTIIGALSALKPLLILPRRSALGEQRNDHQLATADRFAGRSGVTVCREEAEVGPALERLVSGSSDMMVEPIDTEASPELIATLRAFVRGGSRT